MNLVDSLLKADVRKADEFNTDVFNSKRLANILNKKDVDTVEVKLKEINPRKFNDIACYQIDSNGNPDFSKMYDAKLMICINGIVDPDLKNSDLQEHFACNSAKDLCEKLFKSEVNEIADCITNLSGFTSVSDDDIKN